LYSKIKARIFRVGSLWKYHHDWKLLIIVQIKKGPQGTKKGQKRDKKGTKKGQKENIYTIITLDAPIFVLVIDFRNDTKKKCLSLEAHKLRTDKTC